MFLYFFIFDGALTNSKSIFPVVTRSRYLLKVPKQQGPTAAPISMKVVIKRTDKTQMNKGKREGSRNFASLTIVRPDPPHSDGKKRRATLTNFMGEPLSPHKSKKGGSKEGSKTDADPLPMVEFGKWSFWCFWCFWCFKFISFVLV